MAATGTAKGFYSWVGRRVQGRVYGDIDTPGLGPGQKLSELQYAMENADDVSRAIAAEDIAEYREYYDKTWKIKVYDLLWREIGELGDDLMEMTGVTPRNKIPSCTLRVKGTSVHTQTFMKCETTMVGITVETAGLRMAYYVDSFDYEFNESEWVGTVHCLGVQDVLNYLQIWPNWLLPIQTQIPGRAIFIWGIRTVVAAMISECALRIQAGMWEWINNMLSGNLDLRSWFGTVLVNSQYNIVDKLKTPIYVSPINPLLDTSPLCARTVRMESCQTVIEDITRAYGVTITVELWLPGDEQPDDWTKAFPSMRLVQPTYVVKVLDRSQITGPTGTVLDSVLRTIVDLVGSFFGEWLGVVRSVPGMSGVFDSPLLGVNYVAPWAVIIAPDPGERGSVASCKISFHTQKGWQHIVGGRSMKWLNDLFNIIFGFILDIISILLGFIGIPSSLLDGFLNNAILAFQLIEIYGRRSAYGPYHPCMEVMHPTASAPYNIETVFAFFNSAWDSRGYTSGQFMFRDGEVYKLGKDIFLGGLVSLVYDGRRRIFTDYVESIMFRYTPDARDIMVQVGDGKAEEAPLAKHQRFISGVLEAVNTITLAPQSG